MRGIESELRAVGADLTLIGSGGAHYLAPFQEDTGIEARILSDPDRSTYEAAGLKRGIGSTFSARSMLGGLSAYAAGHRQAGVQGDPWQQGGALVVAPDGPVLLHHASDSIGDHVAAEILLEATRAEAARR